LKTQRRIPYDLGRKEARRHKEEKLYYKTQRHFRKVRRGSQLAERGLWWKSHSAYRGGLQKKRALGEIKEKIEGVTEDAWVQSEGNLPV